MLDLKYNGKKFISPAKKKKLFNIYNGLYELMNKINSKKGNNAEIQKQIFENKLIEVFREYPELLYINTDELNKSFLYHAIGNNYFNFVKEMLQNEEVCKMSIWSNVSVIEDLLVYTKDEKYHNIAYQAINTFPRLLRSTICGNGFNLGMQLCDREKLTDIQAKIVYMTIEDEIACLQTSPKGNNIGMLCAKYKKQEFFEKAFKNPRARLQRNKDGDNMEMMAQKNGLIIPPLTEKEVREFYEESISKQIDELCK